MKPPFKDRYSGGGRGFFGNPVHGARLDSKPPNGAGPGSDPEFLRRQLVDEYGIGHAILLPRAFCNLHPDPDFGTAIAAAYNDWLADTWLGSLQRGWLLQRLDHRRPPGPAPPPRARSSAGPAIPTSSR